MINAQTTAQARIDRLVRRVARHWNWLLNGVLLLYAGLPWLSPLLRSMGFERAGLGIYQAYRQFCHQLPERSFALNGFPVCYCHRCTALYTSLLLISLLYTVNHWQFTIGPRLLLLFTLPMVVDGVWHLVNDALPSLALRSDASDISSINFWLRMVTGALFGIGVIVWAYPRIRREFAHV